VLPTVSSNRPINASTDLINTGITSQGSTGITGFICIFVAFPDPNASSRISLRESKAGLLKSSTPPCSAFAYQEPGMAINERAVHG